MTRARWIAACAGLALAGWAVAILVQPDAPAPPQGVVVVPGAPVAAAQPAPPPAPAPSPTPALSPYQDGRDPPAPREANSPNYAELGVQPAI
jgi:hypothetical protein